MSTATPLRKTLLERFPVFASLPEAGLDALLAAATLRQVGAGTRLFEPGLPCTSFPLLLDGSVRVSKVSPGGREIVLYRVGPGEGCVLPGSCLLGHLDYGAEGVAETDATLLTLPPRSFDELVLQHLPFRRFVFQMVGERLAEVMELVDEVAFKRLVARLARLLVQRGSVLQATHQGLADKLGSVRVFVSRLLRGFEERGWVRLERERVTVVDPKAPLDFAKL